MGPKVLLKSIYIKDSSLSKKADIQKNSKTFLFQSTYRFLNRKDDILPGMTSTTHESMTN